MKDSIKGKDVALFLMCGSPEPMANLLYMPQLKMHLGENRIVAEKIFAPGQISDPAAIGEFVTAIQEGLR